MTDDILYRYTQLEDYEIRNTDDGRTLVGIAAPFNSPALIMSRSGQYEESFRKGAFSRSIAQKANKIKVHYQHDKHRLIGAAQKLEERDQGLYVELRVSKTREGDEVLELVRDGALDSFSVGFIPVKGKDIWTADRSKVERTEVKLLEISVTQFPAYQDAEILAVRNEFTVVGTPPRLQKWQNYFRTIQL